MEEMNILLALGEGILLLLTVGSMHRIKRIERKIQKNGKEEILPEKEEKEVILKEEVQSEVGRTEVTLKTESTKEQEKLLDAVLEEIFS
ncbi:MAG: hypothetical protein ACI4ES_08280 [Roseburia sp.]